jgi:hypothetical protein
LITYQRGALQVVKGAAQYEDLLADVRRALEINP